MMNPSQPDPGAMRANTCPACGHHVAYPFFDGGPQPLATVAWPSTEEEARNMDRLPLDFVRCVSCGHVSNASFNYEHVPYTDKPNRMFNKGVLWSQHLRSVLNDMAQRLRGGATVVEIGHGDGSLLTTLAGLRTDCLFIGFDPHGVSQSQSTQVELRASLFEPGRDVAELSPDLIISRHVLEHLMNPLGFVQQIAFAVASLGLQSTLYLEVPCIDRAIDTRRSVDFYYEHNSHFTTDSFTRMLERCGVAIDAIRHGYDGEVIYGFVRLGTQLGQVETALESAHFAGAMEASRVRIVEQLDDLHRSGRTVAVWGGTGKSAAFINRHGMDSERFPTVVDSDALKVGTFVPGAGQEIRSRDWLVSHPVDVLIIPPQWRAVDILIEMQSAGIATKQVLIEHGGHLIDYHRDVHPYASGREHRAA